MRSQAHSLIGKSFDYKVNCFCISEFFYRDTALRQSTADEMLNFVAGNFQQVSYSGPQILHLVWSRSSAELPVGHINLMELAKREPGFPYGLVLEHSFVQIAEDSVFQKENPNPSSRVELTTLTAAISPYLGNVGFEITRHLLTAEL